MNKQITKILFIMFNVACISYTSDKKFKIINQIDNIFNTGQIECLVKLSSKLANLIDPKEYRKKDIKNRLKVAAAETIAYIQRKTEQPEPQLSIIIPCYNREITISDAIHSIYNQTISIPFEVIAVDDASTDNTLNILLEYDKNYPNFFVYQHSKNKGAPEARNTAILHSRSNLIFNLDSDNILQDNIINKIIERYKSKKSIVIFPRYISYFNHDKPDLIIKTLRVKFNTFHLLDLKHTVTFPVTGDCKMFLKNAWLNVGGFLNERGHDSWAFNFMLLASGIIFDFIESGSHAHRIWPDQSNMWYKDYKEGVADKAPLKAIQDNPEVFSPKFQDILYTITSSNKTTLNYFDKEDTFMPLEFLQTYFEGLKNFNEQNYSKSYAFFMNLINTYSLNDIHEFILLKAFLCGSYCDNLPNLEKLWLALKSKLLK